MILGYARVSTVEQRLDMQITALNEAGCTRIFTDKLSGKTAQRLEFKRMLKHLQPGDTLLVFSLSRLFRNTKQLLELFDRFKAERITLRSLTERSIDINTSHGRMIATVLAAVDENEVGRVRDRTVAGMAERGRRGVKFGAPPKVSPPMAAKMKHMRFITRIPVQGDRVEVQSVGSRRLSTHQLGAGGMTMNAPRILRFRCRPCPSAFART
jgi:DNA invertase Pin-like site-specific DNA recombinase